MITAYAVAAGVSRPARTTGIGGVPVELVAHRSLVAAVTRHELAPEATQDAVVAHAGVCEALMTTAEAVLPVRFGAAFADAASLSASLGERYDDLIGGLDHVRGRVEVGVRVRWDDADATEPARSAPGDRSASGRAYMMDRVVEEQRRREAEAKAEAVAARLHEAIGARAVDSRLQVLTTPGLVMTSAYLVDRHDVDRMVAGVRAAALVHPELEVLCTGPWPPYNFADREVSRA